ncbi:peptide-binding protein [Moniliophthora roreri]|nr:peptide-binding protein [Moniliophthora roreri]
MNRLSFYMVNILRKSLHINLTASAFSFLVVIIISLHTAVYSLPSNFSEFTPEAHKRVFAQHLVERRPGLLISLSLPSTEFMFKIINTEAKPCDGQSFQ